MPIGDQSAKVQGMSGSRSMQDIMLPLAISIFLLLFVM